MADSALAVALVEAYVGALLDYVPAPLLVVDPTGRIVRANPDAARLLQRDVIGRPVRSLLPFVEDTSASDVWVGPGLRVRRTRLECPPVGVQIFALEPIASSV